MNNDCAYGDVSSLGRYCRHFMPTPTLATQSRGRAIPQTTYYFRVVTQQNTSCRPSATTSYTTPDVSLSGRVYLARTWLSHYRLTNPNDVMLAKRSISKTVSSFWLLKKPLPQGDNGTDFEKAILRTLTARRQPRVVGPTVTVRGTAYSGSVGSDGRFALWGRL